MRLRAKNKIAHIFVYFPQDLFKMKNSLKIIKSHAEMGGGGETRQYLFPKSDLALLDSKCLREKIYLVKRKTLLIAIENLPPLYTRIFHYNMQPSMAVFQFKRGQINRI